MSEVNKTQAIKLILNGLAEYYGTALTPTRLAMYAEDLEDLELEQIGMAIKAVRRNPNQVFFPLPSVIREQINGNVKDQAMDASSRILEAMGRFGWTNPDGARGYIGEIGWDVVMREGGWTSLCERTTNKELPILKAQWRELAGALIRKDERKSYAALPANEPSKQIEDMAGTVLKEMPK